MSVGSNSAKEHRAAAVAALTDGFRRAPRLLLTSSLASLLLTTTAMAQTAWTGAINGNFLNAANWDAGLPSPTKDASMWIAGLNPPTLSGAGAAQTLTLDHNTLTIAAGASLTAAKGINILSTAATVNNFGAFTSDTGQIANSGALVNAVGGFVTATAGKVLNNIGGTITNDGMVTGATGVFNGPSATMTNSSTGTVSASAGVLENGGTLTNAGTLQALAGSVVNDLGATLANNSGKILGSTGVSNAGTLNNNGTGIVQAVTGNVDNSGTLNNSAKATTQALAGLIANTAGGVIVNDGVLIGQKGVSNAATGKLTNTATGVVTAATSDVTNSGQFINNGKLQALTGGVFNTSGAVLTNIGNVYGQTGISNAATGQITSGPVGLLQAISGDVSNSGSLINAGVVQAYAGKVIVGTTGTFTNNSGQVFGQTGVNSLGILNNNGTGLVQAVTGDFINSGTLNNAAPALVQALAGKFTNSASGIISNDGSLLAATSVSNAGTLTNTAAAMVLGMTDVTNTGTLINSGSVVSSAAMLNSGSITNSGRLAFLSLTNAAGATLTSTGKIDGFAPATVVSNNGTINAENLLNAATFNNAGVFKVTGTLGGVVGKFTNTSTGSVALAADFTGITTFSNDGLLTATGARTLAAVSFNNTANGLVSLANAKTGDSLILTGTYTGTAGSSLQLDVDLSKTSAGGVRSDSLTIAGLATGATALKLTAITPTSALFTAPINVLNVGAGSTLQVTNLGLFASNGVFNYYLKQSTPTSGVYQVVSQFNPAPLTGIASAMRAVSNSLQTSFIQPAAAQLAKPDGCRPNQVYTSPFIHIGGGTDSQRATSTGDIVGGSAPATAANKTTSSFSGLQAGAGMGFCNIQNSGWALNIALTGGQFNASTTTASSQANLIPGGASVGSSSSAKISVPFVGVSTHLSNGQFNLDLDARKDFYQSKVTAANPLPGMLNAYLVAPDTKMSGQNLSFTANASYRFAIGQLFYVQPELGATRGTLKTGALQLASGNGNLLAASRSTSLLTHAGAKLGTDLLVNNSFLVSPFVQAAIWREMDKGATLQAVVGSANQSFTLQSDRIGSFGQAGAGVQVKVPGTALVGFVRADANFGKKINAQAINAGFHLNF